MKIEETTSDDQTFLLFTRTSAGAPISIYRDRSEPYENAVQRLQNKVTRYEEEHDEDDGK